MKTIVLAVSALVVLTILLAAGLGVTLAIYTGLTSPDVTAAIARQENAKAEKLEAEASAERAHADQAWSNAEALRRAIPNAEAALNFAYLGLAVVLVVVLGGIGFSLVTAVSTRARVIYPSADGHAPIIVDRTLFNGTHVIDLARMPGPVAIIDIGGRVSLPLTVSEQTQAQIARSAQMALALTAIASKSKSAPDMVIGRVGELARAIPAEFAATVGAGGDVAEVVPSNPDNLRAERENSWRVAFHQFLHAGDKHGFGNRDLGPLGRKVVTDGGWRQIKRCLVSARVLAVAGEGLNWEQGWDFARWQTEGRLIDFSDFGVATDEHGLPKPAPRVNL